MPSVESQSPNTAIQLPPIRSLFGPHVRHYDPVRSSKPPVSNGYSAPPPPPYYPSQQAYPPPPDRSLSRPSYPPRPPPPAPAVAPSPSRDRGPPLQYLNTPYVPPREHSYPAAAAAAPPPPRPAPSEAPPASTFTLPTLGSSLKTPHTTHVTPYNTSSPAYPQSSARTLQLERDTRPTPRPVSVHGESLRPGPSEHWRPHHNAKNVVEVRDIPGEGEFYILEDGSRMRTKIAGEPVNPAWGVTKAGKPRKRLAKACATCREKKIKCEQGGPGDTKCVQCARLNRPCKIPQDSHGEAEAKPSKRPAPPANTASPPNRFAVPPNRVDNPVRQRHETAAAPHETLNGYSTFAPDRLGSHSHAFDEEHFQGSYQDLQESQAAALARKKGRSSTRGRRFTQPRLPEGANAEKFNARINPYEADPETTLYFLDLFCHHRNASPYVIWPKEHLFAWTRNKKTKSQDDTMVLYAIMAFGSAFSQEAIGKRIGEKCYNIAYSLERDRGAQPSLQLMQARGALLLYNFARGNFEGTFEYTAHAIRTATSMRYTNESRVSEIDETKTIHDFDMTAAQLKECRRRSFYITYFIDRYNSFSYGSMGQIHDVELFLQLPTHDADYEAGQEKRTAAFGGEDVREPHEVEPSPMALLVEITSIWGDVTGNSYRSVNRVPSVYVDYYEDYFRRTRNRMRQWVNSLPEHLRYSRSNIYRAIQEGYFTDFWVLQAIFHLVGMKLGRTGRVDILPDEIKRRNLRMARSFAARFLKIVHALAQQIYKPANDDIDLALSQPFPGYVILNACDVLSAGGRMANLNSMTNCELNHAKQVLEQGAKFWAVAQKQCRAIDDRQGYLSALSMNSSNDRNERMRVDNAIDRSFLPENHDLVYKVHDTLYWEVVLEYDLEGVDPLEL